VIFIAQSWARTRRPLAGDGPDVASSMVLLLGANHYADVASRLGGIRLRVWRSTEFGGSRQKRPATCPRRRSGSHARQERTKKKTSSLAEKKRIGILDWFRLLGWAIGPTRWAVC
jgi:hypothetical protein